MKNIEFKDWLENKLKETPSSHYTPNGNSARAVVSRGKLKELIYQYKSYPKYVMYEIKSFKGLDTPIIYFIQLVVLLVLAPIIPIVWYYHSYNQALGEFKDIFESEKRVMMKKKQEESCGCCGDIEFN